MPKRKHQPRALPTIWRVPDPLWERIKPVLDQYDPPKATGRPRIDQRAALEAIILRLRRGVQWNQLPAALPSDSSVHRTFQRWIARGVFDQIWATLVAECDDLGGVDWHW